MSSSWKKYGGLNKMEKMNNITVNTLVTDTLNVRKSYTNEFDLQGDLNVTGSGQIAGDLLVDGTVSADGIILGATGSIGSSLAKSLVNNGDEVHLVGRDEASL